MANAFQDDKGNNSSMRLVWTFAVILIFSVWAVLCLWKKEWIQFHLEDAVFIAMLFGGKVAQKYFEGRE